MNYLKTCVLVLALSAGIVHSETIKSSLTSQLSAFASTNRKMLYRAGTAAVGVLSYLYYDYALHAPLLQAPVAYRNQPSSVDELQAMLHYAVQEDYALLMSSLEHRFIKDGLHAMSKTQLRNHSRVGAIELATATKDPSTKNISISFASIPGLSQEQIKQLNQLQYQYVQEFYRALSPAKRSYEISTLTKNAFGKKTGFYHYAPTMIQKRKVQQAHMQRAFSCVQQMMAVLKPAVAETAEKPVK